MVKNSNKVMLVSFFVSFLIVCLGLYSLVIAHSHKGKTAITIVAIPADSTISIDGRQSTLGVHYISPGQHRFTASRQYFNDVSESVSVAIDSPQTINLLPLVSSDKARTFLKARPDEAKKREQIAGEAFQKNGEIIARKYPYIGKLPIFSRGFTINQGEASRTKVAFNDASIALQVNAAVPLARTAAVDRIIFELGIDPTTVEIDFLDQVNIFQSLEDR